MRGVEVKHVRRKDVDLEKVWDVESATGKGVGVDPRAYLLRAVYAAIGRPGTVTFPEDLLASTLTG
jgi:hypothetical protein